MRNSLAVGWVESGGSLVALKEMLGHADIHMTIRNARISEDMAGRESERVSAVVRSLAREVS